MKKRRLRARAGLRGSRLRRQHFERKCSIGFEHLEERLVLSSVTVVSHGANILGSGGPLNNLGQELFEYWSAQDITGLYSYRPQDGSLVTVQTNGANPENSIIVFDWSSESDTIAGGFDEAAGDALFSTLIENDLANSDYLHLIGHSRGAIVVSEASQRLLTHGFDVDQLTLLDQEPGGSPFDSVGPPHAWEGIGFVDNYYGDGSFGLQGEFVSGAHNVDFAQTTGALRDEADINGNGSVGHTEVRTWYEGTINQIDSSSGFTLRRDSALRNSVAQQGSRRLLETVPSVFNGDFEFGFGSTVPGWERQGGGGTGHVDGFFSSHLELDFGDESRTHNRLYIPNNVEFISFDLQRSDASSNDVLSVRIGETLLREFDLEETDSGYINRVVPVPERFRDSVQRITFEIVSDGITDSEVRIDNVRLIESIENVIGSPADIQISSSRFSYSVGEVVSVSGTVVDANGQPIGNWPVYIEDSLQNQSRLLGTTAADGAFSAIWSGEDTIDPGLFGLTFVAGGTAVETTVVVGIVDPSLDAISSPNLDFQIGVVQEVNQQTSVVIPSRASGVAEPDDSRIRSVLEDITFVVGGAIQDTLSQYSSPGEIGAGRALGLAALGVGCVASGPVCAAASAVFLKSFAFDAVVNLAHRTIDLQVANNRIDAAEANAHRLFIDTAALGVGIVTLTPSTGLIRNVRRLEDLSNIASIVEDGIIVGQGLSSLTMVGRDSQTGNYYGIVLQTGEDRHGDDRFSATAVSSNMSIGGIIEIPQDEDWFAIPLTAGRTYRFETILNGLSDSRLSLFDLNGTTSLASDDNSGVGNASRIEFTPTVSGTYFLSVAGNGGNAGAFGLEIDETIVATSPEVQVTAEFGQVQVNQASFIDFETLPVGAIPFSRTLTVSNLGNANLSLSNLIVPAPYVLRDDLVPNLGPGQSDTIRIELPTTSAGNFSRTLAFDTNDSDEGRVSLFLTGKVQDLPTPAGEPELTSVRVLPSEVAFGKPVTISAQASHGDGNSALNRVEIYRDLNGNGVIDASDQRVANQPTDSSGRVRAEVFAFYERGSHTFLLRAVDQDGKISNTQRAGIVLTDNRPTDPVIVRVSAAPSNLNPGDEMTIRWLARDNTAVDHVQLYLYAGQGTSTSSRVDTSALGGASDGRLTIGANDLPNDRKFIWTIPPNLPGRDDYRIGLVAVDEDGNSSIRFSDFFSVTAPGARLISLSSEPGSVLAGGDVTLTATVVNAQSARSVTFVRDTNRNSRFDFGEEVLGTRSNFDGDGRVVLTASTSGLSPGSHRFLAMLNLPDDSVGNRVVRNVTVRGLPNQPPEVGSTVISPSSVTRGDSITITTSGISDDRGVDSIVFVWDANGDGEPGGGDIPVGRTSVVSGGRASVTIPTTRFDIGNQQIIVRVRDGEGKFRDSGAASVQINAPVLPDPFISGIIPNASFQAIPFTFTLTAQDVLHADEVRFFHDSNNNGRLDANDQLLRIDDESSDGFFWRDRPDNAGLPIGSNRFFAQAFNSLGTGSNVVEAIAEFHATDTEPPTAQVLSAEDVISQIATYEFVVEYRDNIALRVADFDDTNTEVLSADGTWAADAELVTIDEPVEGPVRLVTYRITAPGGQFDPEDNGAYRIIVDGIRDTNGNRLDRTTAGTFEVAIPFEDSTPPQIFFDRLSSDLNSPTTMTEPQVFGVTADDQESGIEPSSYEYFAARFDGSQWGPWQLRGEGDSFISFDDSDSDGLYRLYASARNRAGITGLSQTYYVLLDREAPARVQGLAFAADTGRESDDGLTQAPLVSVSWTPSLDTVSEVIGYYYALDDLTPQTGGGFTEDVSATVRLTEGANTFYVQAVDRAGNVSVVNALQVHLDSVHPTVANVVPANFSTLGAGPDFLIIDFDEEIDQSTFQTTDLVFSGAGGSIVPSGIDWIDRDTVRVSLNGTWGVGVASVEFVNAPADVAGNVVLSHSLSTFTLSPDVAPEIEVRTSDGTNITDGGLTFDFGSVVLGDSPRTASFTVANVGDGTLNIFDLVTPTGIAIVAPPPGSLAPGASGTFTVELSSGSVGPVSGQLSLLTNDADENSFDLSVRGQVESPGITAIHDHALVISSPNLELIKDVAVDAEGNLLVTGEFSGGVDFDPGPGSTLLTSQGFRDVFVAKYSEQGELIWARSFGGTSAEEVAAIAVGENGNIHVVGEFRRTVDFDPGPGVENRATFTAQLSPNGAEPDVFALELTSEGLFESVHTFGADGIDEGFDVAVRNDEVYIVGSFQETVDFDPGPGRFNLTPQPSSNPNGTGTDGFLVKLDANGNFVFAKQIGGPSTDWISGVAVGNDGRFAITGSFYGGDFDPQGSGHVVDAIGRDAFVAQYSSGGDFQWVRVYNGRVIGFSSGSDDGNAVAIDGDNNVIATGVNWGTLDDAPAGEDWGNNNSAFVVSLNSSGQTRWLAHVGSPARDEGHDLEVDADGNVYVAGHYEDGAIFQGHTNSETRTSVGSRDLFAMRLSPDGELQWVRTVGSSQDDHGNAIAVGDDGDVLVGGYFRADLDVNPDSGVDIRTHVGEEDALVIRLRQPEPIDNQSPQLDSIASRVVEEGSTLRIVANAIDPDGDGLTYSLDPGAPLGAVIDPVTGEFTWTPSELDGPSSHTLTIRATDDAVPAFSDSRSFVVEVTEQNQTPVLSAVGPQFAVRGSLLSVQLEAFDPDIPTNSLTYQIDDGVPVGLDIDASTGLIQWIPDETSPGGRHVVTVSVFDDGQPRLVDTKTFEISLPNALPTLDPIEDRHIDEDVGQQTIVLTGISAGATENQLLRLDVISNDPSVIPQPTLDYSISDDTASIHFQPLENAFGFADIFIAVGDAGFDGIFNTPDDREISESFRVIVNPVNDSPTLDLVPHPVPIRANATQQVIDLAGISAGPGEVQALEITAISDNSRLIPNPTIGLVSSEGTGTLSYQPFVDETGEAEITVHVRDAGLDGVLRTVDDGLHFQTFSVTVLGIPEIEIAPSGSVLEVSESGAEDTLTVSLGAQPLSDVVLEVSAVDSTEVTINRNTLTFTPLNWHVGQEVSLVGQDDQVADGDKTTAVLVSVIDAGSDRDFRDVTPKVVNVRTLDDEVAGYHIDPTILSVGELGSSDAFQIALAAQPESTVVIDVVSGDIGEAISDVTSLTFLPSDWNQPQSVTVTGVNDNVDDGDQEVFITLSIDVATSDDAFAAVADQSVVIVNVDDDTRGISVSAISGNTSESGGAASFSVALQSEPSDDVTIGLSSSDDEEGNLLVTALTFNRTNWNQPQLVTVMGVDDDVDDGDASYRISISATGGDYQGISVEDVTLINTDDDTAGFTLDRTTAQVSEAGTTDFFRVVLDAQPLSEVVLLVGSDNEGEAVIDRPVLTFTPENWNQPQTVTVEGVDDHPPVIDEDQSTIITLMVDGDNSDVVFSNSASQSINVTTLDNDAAGIAVTRSSGVTRVDESGAADSFGVALTAQPESAVVIHVASSDRGEVISDVTSLTFLPSDWDQPQFVTVTGVNDNVDDGDQEVFITLSIDAASSDDVFDAIADQSVAIVNADDDTRGISVSSISGNTSESGGAASLSVALQSEPTAEVTLGIASSNPNEGIVSSASLRFTPENWQQTQVVTVSGVDDDVDDGDVPYSILLAAAVGGDYQGVSVDDVTLINTDDDAAGFTLDRTTAEVSESGTTDSFRVVLDAQPLSEVVLLVGSDNEGEAVVDHAVLTFTPGNWNQPQAVTVTGVDDNLDDGDQETIITLSIDAASSDDVFDPVANQSVAIVNTDDDTAGFTVDRTTAQVSESGTTDSFSVVLDAQPLSEVVLLVSSNNEGEAIVDRAVLTFGSENWNQPQAVTITGVDDNPPSVDGDQVTQVTVRVDANRSDSRFISLADQAIEVTTADNDQRLFDFGDAPNALQSGLAADYPVTLEQDGARHVIGPLRLGQLVDGEADGQPDANAGQGDSGGDDNDDLQDEDGVTALATALTSNVSATYSSFMIDATLGGRVDGWIDFNQDGDWDDDGEQILDSINVSAGENVVSFRIPIGATAGVTAARFRISSSGSLAPTGEAVDGEVEDYLIHLSESAVLDSTVVHLTELPTSISWQPDAITIAAGQSILFGAPVEGVRSLDVRGTSRDDTLTIDLDANSDGTLDGLSLDGGQGINTLVINGDGGSLDLSLPEQNVFNFSQIDLSGDGAAVVVLDTASVSAATADSSTLRIVGGSGDRVIVSDAGLWRMSTPTIRNEAFFLTAQAMESDESIEVSSPQAWQNFLQAGDVNNDGSVTALDALQIINELNWRRYSGGVEQRLRDPIQLSNWPSLYFDYNGDGRATALDALRVINELSRISNSGGQAEGEEGLSSLFFASSNPLHPQQATRTLDPAAQELGDLTPTKIGGKLAVPTQATALSRLEIPQEEGSRSEIPGQAVDELLRDESFWRQLEG